MGTRGSIRSDRCSQGSVRPDSLTAWLGVIFNLAIPSQGGRPPLPPCLRDYGHPDFVSAQAGKLSGVTGLEVPGLVMQVSYSCSYSTKYLGGLYMPHGKTARARYGPTQRCIGNSPDSHTLSQRKAGCGKEATLKRSLAHRRSRICLSYFFSQNGCDITEGLCRL